MLEFPKKFSIIVNPKNISSQIKNKTIEYDEKQNLFNKYKTIQTEKLNKIDNDINEKTNLINSLLVKIYNIDVNTKKELALRNKYENEQIRITNYCNDLKRKHSNIEQTKVDYENKIELLKYQNQQLAKEYDLKINTLNNENRNLNEQITDRINLYNNNKTEIVLYQNRIKEVLNEIEEQRIKFKEKEQVNNIKYEELENKFMNLQKKIYDLQMNNDLRKTELIKNRRIQKKIYNEKEDLENELKQLQNSNKELEKQIEKMNKYYKNLTNNENLNRLKRSSFNSRFKK